MLKAIEEAKLRSKAEDAIQEDVHNLLVKHMQVGDEGAASLSPTLNSNSQHELWGKQQQQQPACQQGTDAA